MEPQSKNMSPEVRLLNKWNEYLNNREFYSKEERKLIREYLGEERKKL